MTNSLTNFVDILRQAHEDGSRLDHFARHRQSNADHSTMPVTAFIYEFFLYNSVVDP